MTTQTSRDWLFVPGGSRMAQLASDQFLLAPIRRAICKRFNVTEVDLEGPRRVADIAEARQFAYFLSRNMTGLSFPRIGRVFGFRDHSTIVHGCDKVEWMTKNEPGIETILREIAAEAREEMFAGHRSAA